MEFLIKTNEHGIEVVSIKDLKDKQEENSLCTTCTISECDIRNLLQEFKVSHGVVAPVYECAGYPRTGEC